MFPRQLEFPFWDSRHALTNFGNSGGFDLSFHRAVCPRLHSSRSCTPCSHDADIYQRSGLIAGLPLFKRTALKTSPFGDIGTTVLVKMPHSYRRQVAHPIPPLSCNAAFSAINLANFQVSLDSVLSQGFPRFTMRVHLCSFTLRLVIPDILPYHPNGPHPLK